MADANRLFYDHVWPQRAMVLRTARFLTRNDAEADDLTQETLVKAFKSIEQFDTTSQPKAWLSAILRNTWIDRLRSAGRHGGMGGGVSFESQEIDIEDMRGRVAEVDRSDPAALLEQFSDADMIKALRGLPEEIRWTLMLVDVEQIDHEDAAQVLGIPPGTVKSRAHRGRRMLRDSLLAQQMPAEGSI